MQRQPALPKIEVTKLGKLFRVDWDYQEAPESDVLHRENDYLYAYLKGALDALDVSQQQRVCVAGRTGAVNMLSEAVAKKVAEILEGLLFPLVNAEHERLLAEERLPPHLKSESRSKE